MLNVFITKNDKNFIIIKQLLLISLFVTMFFVVALMIPKGTSAAGFDLATSEGVKNAYQSETITFTMNATSISSSAITANVTSTYPVGWEAPIYQSTLNILANSSRTFVVSVPVSSTTTPGVYYVNITLTDVSNTSQTAQCPLRINVLQTVNTSCSEPTHTTKPDSGVGYTVKISNKGVSTVTDTISLTINKSNSAWNASISSSSVFLKGGEYQNVIVTITPPLNAALNESVVATVTAKFDIGTYLGAYSTIDLTTTVSQKYGVILYGSSNVTCTPGTPINYTLNISNTGNGYDTYIMSATENAEWVSFGDYQQVTVGPNQTTSIPIAITAKSGTLVGSYTITLKGTSKYDASAVATKSIFVTASQVYGVNITSDTLYASVLSGLFTETTVNTTTFNITVTNTGNGPDIVDIRTTGLYTNWSSLNISRVVLSANKSTQVSLTVNVSAGTFTGDYNITAIANSVTDTSKTSTLNFLLKVSQNFGTNIVCLDASNEVNPSVSTKTTYVLEIWNTGNGQDTILLNITSAPRGWANLSDGRVTLSPNTNQSVILTVDVPLGTPAGSYAVSVSATPNTGRSNTSSVNTTTTKVLPVYGIRLSTNNITATSYPDTNVTFPITIINTGTGADSVSFGIIKPSTWDAKILVQSVEIGYGKNTSADLILTIPVGEQSSAVVGSYNITLMGASVGDNSKTSSLPLSVYVNSRYGVEIRSGPNNTAKPGETMTYPINITNTGNIQDTIGFSVESKPTDWNIVFLSGSTPISSLTLPAKTVSTGLLISVSIPSTESTNGTIIIAAKSQNDGTKSSSVSIFTTIKVPKYGVNLHSSNLNQSVSLGNKTTYAVAVSNTGDSIDTILLTVVKPSASWDVVLSDDSGKNISAVTIQANISKNIFVTATPPNNAEADNFTIDIIANSQSDSKISATIKLNVAMQPARNTILKIIGRTPTQLDPNIEKSIDYSLVFSNAGNIMENVTFSVTVPTGWSFLIENEEKRTASFGLASDMETTSKLRLIIPSDAVSGENRIYVDADLKGGYWVRGNIIINIVKPTLAIHGSDITFSNLKPTEGETVMIGVVVWNTGTADATDVQLQFYDGNTPLGSTITDIPAAGNIQVQYSWVVTKGVHTIKVKISGDIIQDSYAQNVNTSKPISGEEKSLIFFTKSATLSNIKFIGAGAGIGIVFICIIWAAVALRRRRREREKEQLEDEKKQRREASVERWKETKKSSTISIGEPSRPQVRMIEPKPKQIEKIEKKDIKPIYVRCPKCGELKEIKTTLRPIQVTCSRCSTKIGIEK